MQSVKMCISQHQSSVSLQRISRSRSRSRNDIFYGLDKISFIYCTVFAQEYSFQVTLRQQWNDKRLRFEELLKAKGVGDGKRIRLRENNSWTVQQTISSQDKIRYLTMTDASKVWMPDTFFRWEHCYYFTYNTYLIKWAIWAIIWKNLNHVFAGPTYVHVYWLYSSSYSIGGLVTDWLTDQKKTYPPTSHSTYLSTCLSEHH